jgi:hypothetical protein
MWMIPVICSVLISLGHGNMSSFLCIVTIYPYFI